MVEVTAEDWDAAQVYADLYSGSECYKPSYHQRIGEASARHRIAAYQRGKIEGARLAIEAVLPEVVTDRTIDAHGAHCRCTTCELNIAEDAIRALSPAKIVGADLA